MCPCVDGETPCPNEIEGVAVFEELFVWNFKSRIQFIYSLSINSPLQNIVVILVSREGIYNSKQKNIFVKSLVDGLPDQLGI